jgi:hypothetical protein
VRPYGSFLCDAFGRAPLDAQCALLSREIEPELGLDLARRWREKTAAGPYEPGP